MEIEIEVKTVYGNELIYVTSEHREPLQKLTGKKTLNQGHVEALKALGFTFKVKPSTIGTV